MKLEFRRRRRTRCVRDVDYNSIRILAHLHRNFIVLCIPLWLAALLIFGKGMVAFLSVACTFWIYALWSFLACIFKWKHYYCSMQLLNKKRMTPDDIRIEDLSFFDRYGTPIIFAIAGIIFLLFSVF